MRSGLGDLLLKMRFRHAALIFHLIEMLLLVQILSWRPRAVYFPNFATDEQCQSIIKLAKSKLKPSALALRKGETAESTKGVRTRYFLFPQHIVRSGRIVLFLENKQPIAYHFHCYILWSCYFNILHSRRNMLHLCSY